MLGSTLHRHFGSKMGFLRSLGYWTYGKVGGYRQYPPVKPQSHQRLVFICSGNICRSPLAEVYANSLGKSTASCGLNCGTGFPADTRAQKFAEQNGLNLNRHRTVNVRDFTFRADDFVVVMEPSHLTSLRFVVDQELQVVLAGTFLNHPHPYIHDPYSCSAEFFERCENKVMQAVRRICE